MKFIKNTRGTIGAKIYGIGEIHIGHSTEGKDNLINILEQNIVSTSLESKLSIKLKKNF